MRMHAVLQKQHLVKMTATVKGYFQTPITAGTYSRLAGLMSLSNKINSHMYALENIPAAVPSYVYPLPGQANLISLPRPEVKPQQKRARRQTPTPPAQLQASSLTMAIVNSRLTLQREQASRRLETMLAIQESQQIGWASAYEQATSLDIKQTVSTRLRSGSRRISSRSSTSSSTSSSSSGSSSSSSSSSGSSRSSSSSSGSSTSGSSSSSSDSSQSSVMRGL